MKAIVEFEVNGCGDCILNNSEWEYCCHPEVANKDINDKISYWIDIEGIEKYPDWCPILGNNPHLTEN